MNCPRCLKGRLLPTLNVDSEIPTPTCYACGYEDFPRPTISLEAVLADLHSEARSMSTAKRPSHEWE